jgi:hypothetical protein
VLDVTLVRLVVLVVGVMEAGSMPVPTAAQFEETDDGKMLMSRVYAWPVPKG